MKRKVVIYRKIDARVVDFLRQKFDVVYIENVDESTYPLFEAHLHDADVLMGGDLKITKEILDKCPNLKIVSNVSAGFDNLDLNLLSHRNIIATNTPDVLNETVADVMFGLILATARRISELDTYVKDKKWDNKKISEELFGLDVHGKTIGIVGLGRIGQAIAKRAHFGFDMKILYHNRNRNKHAEVTYNATYYNLPELLKRSDFVCSMVPLNNATKNLFGKEEFELMKTTGIFINGSRGGVVDEKALHNALVNEKIAAAGLDVYKNEPVEDDNPLLTLDNLVTLPHIGSATGETRYKMTQLAADSIIKILDGEIPHTVLNKEALSLKVESEDY